MSKETLRKAIAKHTKEYLERGGVIEIVPKGFFVPHWHRWMIKWGWDYHALEPCRFPLCRCEVRQDQGMLRDTHRLRYLRTKSWTTTRR